MKSSTALYTPQVLMAAYRGLAWKVWIFATILVALWVLAILSAPVFAAYGATGVSVPIIHFFGFVCHQMPDRSFHVLCEPFAVCSRCFGVYFGILLGFVIYPVLRNIHEVEPLPRFWLFLSLLPISIDWSLTFFDIWENTHPSRFITGLILGIACAVFIVPALVEITRNISDRRRTF
jgi:uncharacterized membrane protein